MPALINATRGRANVHRKKLAQPAVQTSAGACSCCTAEPNSTGHASVRRASVIVLLLICCAYIYTQGVTQSSGLRMSKSFRRQHRVSVQFSAIPYAYDPQEAALGLWRPHTLLACGSAPQGDTLVLGCPSGVIGGIEFADFGTVGITTPEPGSVGEWKTHKQGLDCGPYKRSHTCHSKQAWRSVSALCVGKPSCSILADESTLNSGIDPCPQFEKFLAAEITHCAGALSLPTDAGDAPPVPMLVTGAFLDPEDMLVRQLESIDHPIERIMVHVGQKETSSLFKKLRKLITKHPKMLGHMEIIAHGVNLGYSAGINHALRLLNVERLPWLLATNADIAFEPGALNVLSHEMSRHRLDPKFGLGLLNMYPSAHFSAFTITHSLYQAVGEFDENFFPGFYEDDDYAYRVHLSQFEAAKLENVNLIHGRNKGDAGYSSGMEAVIRKLAKEAPRQSEELSYFKHGGGLASNQAYFNTKWGGEPNGCKFMGFYPLPFYSLKSCAEKGGKKAQLWKTPFGGHMINLPLGFYVVDKHRMGCLKEKQADALKCKFNVNLVIKAVIEGRGLEYVSRTEGARGGAVLMPEQQQSTQFSPPSPSKDETSKSTSGEDESFIRSAIRKTARRTVRTLEG